MSQKWMKKLIGAAFIGAAIGGGIAYLNKKKKEEADLSDEFEDEDFDLDDDLAEVPSRGYVSLSTDAASNEVPVEDNTSAEPDNAETLEEPEVTVATEASEESEHTEE